MFKTGCKRLKINKKAHFFRILFSLFLNITLLAATFPKSLILLDYYLDTEAYAAYCINKDNPEMECNGMCQMDDLMKKMDHNHNHSGTSPERISIVYTVPAVAFSQLQKPLIRKGIFFPQYREFVPQAPHHKLLRPPQNLS